MKCFLCLLIVELIACESADKNNEIILKESDFINELFDKLIIIFKKCNYDKECINNQTREYFYTFDYFEKQEWISLTLSHDCYDFCYNKLSKEIEPEFANTFCRKNCPLSEYDYIGELFDKLIFIFINCNYDKECINSQIKEYFDTFDSLEMQEWRNFKYSRDCYDICYNKLSKDIELEFVKTFCRKNCPRSECDFIGELFDKLIIIFKKCNYDKECINSQIKEYFGTFDSLEMQEWRSFKYSRDCYDICYNKLSKEIKLEFATTFCKNNCHES